MQTKKVNAKLLWIQFEDVLAPRLGLTIFNRAVYSHLLRHSLVVGKLRALFDLLRGPGSECFQRTGASSSAPAR